MITKDTYVQGKSTTGTNFICAKVVDIFNNLAFISLGNKVLKCKIDDLKLI